MLLSVANLNLVCSVTPVPFEFLITCSICVTGGGGGGGGTGGQATSFCVMSIIALKSAAVVPPMPTDVLGPLVPLGTTLVVVIVVGSGVGVGVIPVGVVPVFAPVPVLGGIGPKLGPPDGGSGTGISGSLQ